MATESVYVRLDEQTLERIDTLVVEMSEGAKGAKLTRSHALRVLVDRGLASLDADKKSKRR